MRKVNKSIPAQIIPRSNRTKISLRGVVVNYAIMSALIGLVVLFAGVHQYADEDFNYIRFLELLDNGQIILDKRLRIIVEEDGTQFLQGHRFRETKAQYGPQTVRFRTKVNLDQRTFYFVADRVNEAVARRRGFSHKRSPPENISLLPVPIAPSGPPDQ